MDNSAANIDPLSTLATRSGDGGVARGYGLPFSVSDLIQAPLSALLEYSGILRRESNQPENERLIGERFVALSREPVNESVYETGEGEVSIRIIGLGDQENPRTGAGTPQPGAVSMGRAGDGRNTAVYSEVVGASLDGQEGMQVSHGDGVDLSPSMTGYTTSSSSSSAALHGANGEGGSTGVSDRDSTYQSYDVQQAARWIEPVLPFSLLLLLVFIRQHFQDFLITIWLAAVMFKSNDIVRKQTALKGERRIFILVGITLIFVLHVGGVYWWYKNGDLFYPLVMLPPKDIPPFWHAIFIILVNDTIVRQAAMIVKCILLMYYKNTRGRNYHKQGQLLTLVEYLVLLYRSLLPAPVWYRFFLNKEYGSLFSSLTTGLYLTFKLTSVVGKIQSFLAAIKALSGKELPYGSHASAEQVIAVGDLCTICQERMHAPILLCCKHIFCEDCVSEWFERERSCPICRALVRPAGIRSFGDSSTSLFFQIF